MCALLGFDIRRLMIFLTVVGALGNAMAEAPVCNAKGFITAATPLCPKTGSMLPENYPVMSLSISDDAGDEALVESTIDKALKAQSSPAPLLFLNVTPEHFKALQAHLQSSPWATSEMKSRLRLVHSTGLDDDSMTETDAYFNWQQDFYKGFFDPRTGLPVAGIFENYPEIGHLAETFPNDLKACGISSKALPTRISRLPKNGFSGGNIDMIPSGICLLGRADLTDQEWDIYSKNICGNATRIQVPSEWLTAHHTDEIFKSLPTNDPAPCNFALAFASPQKALEILAQNPDEQAFDFPIDQNIYDNDSRLKKSDAMNALCAISDEIDEAHAHHRSVVTPDVFEPFDKSEPLEYRTLQALYFPPNFCVQMKNRDLIADHQVDEVLRNYNQLVQKKIDAFKKQLLAQVQKNLPQCQIKTIDVPDLFWGNLHRNSQGQYELPEGSGSSVFPNPTNSDIIGKTILFPKPYNKNFEKNLIQQFSALGLQVDFVDTFESHIAHGNLHCMTQILRYCRP